MGNPRNITAMGGEVHIPHPFLFTLPSTYLELLFILVVMLFAS
jgi:hypothetical protein